MNPKAASITWCLLCAVLLIGACTSVPAAGQGSQASPAAAATTPVMAPTVAAEAQAAPMPAAGAQPSQPVRADKKPKPTPAAGAQPSQPAKADKKPKPTPAAGEATAAPFVVPNILGRPTDRSVTVNVVPARDLEVYFEYGAAPGVYTGRTPPETHSGGQPFEVTLDGLPPNAHTYYRMRYRQPGAADFAADEERSFTTQRAPGSTFTFGIQGDSHPERLNKQFDPDLYTRTLASAAADRPDFYLTIGDDFSVDNLKTVNADTVAQLYVDQRRWLGLVGAPVFLVNGNHEQASMANLDGTPDNVAVWAQAARNAYYPQPAPDRFYTGDAEPVEFIGPLRDYYAFTWGDALFMVIDPYWHSPETVDNQFGADRQQKAKRDLWNVTLGEEQYQWFKQTLENSSAKYRFVFAHHVNGTGRGGVELAYTYEWGDAAGFPEHRPGWDKPIHQLMADNGVAIFFQGHDHIFVRQELDGVVYQTLPEPANPNYTYENAAAYRSGDKLPNSGHVRVTVSPAQVTVDYIRTYLPADEKDIQTNGDVAFSYTIPGGAPPQAAATPRSLPARLFTSPSPASPQPSTGTFPGTILLGSPTDRSVTACLLSGAGLEAYLEYGAASGAYTGQTTPVRLPAGEPVEVVMEGLKPDTSYFYRLRYRGTGETLYGADIGRSFHTQRQPGSAFTFTLDADPHYGDPSFNAAVYSVTLRSALTDRPDFHIDIGDTFMTEKLAPASYEEAAAPYREMRPFFGILAPYAPLFLVNGNHDGELGWRSNGPAQGKGRDSTGNLAVWATQARRTYYPVPEPGGFYTGSTGTPGAGGSAAGPLTGVRDSYYAWTWGDALFVVLDPFWYSTVKPQPGGGNWDLTLGEEQYRWLQQTLETSKARFKFVFAHNLVGGMDQNMRGGVEAAGMWEWGGRNADGSWGFTDQRPGWEAPIHQLLVDNHVTIFFHGHDHLFVKQELDGIVYQEVPQPSYASYDRTGSAAQYGYTHADVLGCCGYLRVAVSPAAVKVDYVRSYLPADENAQRKSGQVSYSYTVPAH
jgi:phosphodiesterase/alkaline phosphatase D-like protein